MKTIFKPAAWRILQLFYNSRNAPLHLRAIARQARLNESSASRQLNALVNANILSEKKEANLRRFAVKRYIIPKLFPLYDDEKLSSLPPLREDAILHYVSTLKKKPILMVIFGSTADKTFTEDSDVDILEVFSGRTDTTAARKYAEAQTGIRIHSFQLTEDEFNEELKEQQDMVIQSALETGFPVWNNRYYYELILHERTRFARPAGIPATAERENSRSSQKRKTLQTGTLQERNHRPRQQGRP